MAFLPLNSHRLAGVALCMVLTAGWLVSARPGGASQAAAAAAPRQSQPVLVELFTSEGCSDCPPADALLARLDATQFVPGAQAIVLSEHVTYWNHQGWRDPFSFDAIDERQKQYVFRFGLDSSYTPQMVVDGAQQMVGNDAAAVSRAVARAAAKAKAEISIGDARWVDGSLSFAVHGDARPDTTLVAALAENATHSEVARGENAGRTLNHVAVVRVLKDFGANAVDGRQLRLSGGSLSQGNEAAGPVRLVVFLADRKTGHVVSVAEQTVNR